MYRVTSSVPAAIAITTPVRTACSGRVARSARITRIAARSIGSAPQGHHARERVVGALGLAEQRLGGDAPVAHPHDAVGRARDAQVVGDEDDRLALAVALA